MHSTKFITVLTIIITSWCSAVSTQDTEYNSEDTMFECGSEENLQHGNFTVYDYTVVIMMLVISLGIGVFYGYFQKSSSGGSSSDFLLGSQMSVFPVTLSLTSSFITAIELLGNPSEMFYNGTQFSLIVISMVFVVPVAVKIFYPIYFKMEVTSCYEYLGMRFGKDIRIFGAVLYILQMSFYTSVAVLAPAIALSKATGLNTRLAIVLIYFVCIFYSSQGGMKAVVIADTFQACVLVVSLILILALGYHYTGDITKVFETSQYYHRIELFNIDTNPTTRHSVYSVIIGGFFYWTSMFCTNQASVQKCMSLKSMKTAKIAIYFSVIGLIFVFVINFYTGLMTFTHYAGCDPLKSGQISAKDQLLPFYVMDVFGEIKFVTGIFVAGIFAASLGTVASALNSLSAVTCEDLLVAGLNIKMTPEKGAIYAKWMSLGFGVLSFMFVFIVEKLGGILQATLTLNGLIGGVTLGLFSLGIFFKNANNKGALYGGILSLVFVVYIGVMAQIKNEEIASLPSSIDECNCFMNNSIPSNLFNDIVPTTTINEVDLPIDENMSSEASFSSSVSSIYRISYMWYSFLGTFLTIFFGFIISIATDEITKRKLLKITAKTAVTSDKRNEASSLENGNYKLKIQNRNLDAIDADKIFVIGEFYSPSSLSSMKGIDNFALEVDHRTG